jgi:hypothetical protein
LICLDDGKIVVTAAETGGTGETTLAVDPLAAIVASGTACVFSGGATFTTNAEAAEGARNLTSATPIGVTAIAQGETASVVYFAFPSSSLGVCRI